MKKTLLIVFLVICFSITVNAQTKTTSINEIYTNGNQVINGNLIVQGTIDSFGLKSFGNGAISIGEDVVPSGDLSIGMGLAIDIKGSNSSAIGSFITVHSDETTAIGKGIIASGTNSTILGRYNIMDQNKIFVIGNGDSGGNRHNGLTLDYHGNLRIAGSFAQSSDARLKENLSKISNSLEKLSKIQGYYYNFKNDNSKKKKIGLLAQDVLATFPESVVIDSQDYLAVDYNSLIAVLVESVKELNEKVDRVCR